MKKLPIGIQTFEEIITENFLYVDKTKEVYSLANAGKYFFISRPRRFGKSLLCSTLKSLFEGRKDLFKGLWIENSDWTWKKHPVVHIELAGLPHTSAEKLEAALCRMMKKYIKQHNLNVELDQTPGELLHDVVIELAQKEKAVVIIDEYDDPLLSNITKQDVAQDIRDILRDFYKTLKKLDPYLRFVFITGVSKFSKTSIFSGLNNLKDVSLSEKFATTTGYTKDEIQKSFSDRLSLISQKRNKSIELLTSSITHWYDGYKFHHNGTHMYNPFSVLNYLSEGELRNYWFETGTPTFLMKLLEKKQYPTQLLDNVKATTDELGSFDVEYLSLKTLLFQTGYLTITHFDETLKHYTLNFPNEEVRYSFLTYLANHMTHYERSDIDTYSARISQAFASKDFTELFRLMTSFFAGIPYTIHIPLEKYYQSLFFTILKLVGGNIVVEDPTNIGRIDSVYETERYIYVIEFKINKSPQEAMNQIEEKRYFEKFLYTRKQIILLGINFDTSKKNLDPRPIIKTLQPQT